MERPDPDTILLRPYQADLIASYGDEGNWQTRGDN